MRGGKQGLTALHLCLEFGKDELTLELIKAGVNINKVDYMGRRPLSSMENYYASKLLLGI